MCVCVCARYLACLSGKQITVANRNDTHAEYTMLSMKPHQNITPSMKRDIKNMLDSHPVDGRHPAPVERQVLPLFTSFLHPRWLAGFPNHQQYNPKKTYCKQGPYQL